MLRKHGTGEITEPDDTGTQPVAKTASQWGEEEWDALMTEGEPERE